MIPGFAGFMRSPIFLLVRDWMAGFLNRRGDGGLGAKTLRHVFHISRDNDYGYWIFYSFLMS
jgi:hypothetical protein